MEKNKFETKNISLFGYFWTGIWKNYCIFEIGSLEFIKNEFSTDTVNFDIGTAFSKGPGSLFSEDPGPGPGPLYKVCRKPVLFILHF